MRACVWASTRACIRRIVGQRFSFGERTQQSVTDSAWSLQPPCPRFQSVIPTDTHADDVQTAGQRKAEDRPMKTSTTAQTVTVSDEGSVRHGYTLQEPGTIISHARGGRKTISQDTDSSGDVSTYSSSPLRPPPPTPHPRKHTLHILSPTLFEN